MHLSPIGYRTPKEAARAISWSFFADEHAQLKVSRDDRELHRKYRKAIVIRENCEFLGVSYPKEIDVYFDDKTRAICDEIRSKSGKEVKLGQYAFNLLITALREGDLSAIMLLNGTREQIDLPPHVWWQSDSAAKLYIGDLAPDGPEIEFQITKTEIAKGVVLIKRQDLDNFILANAPINNATIHPEDLGQGKPRRRGPAPITKERVVREMNADIKSGETSASKLEGEKEEVLAEKYGASRDTIRKARIEVLSRYEK